MIGSRIYRSIQRKEKEEREKRKIIIVLEEIARDMVNDYKFPSTRHFANSFASRECNEFRQSLTSMN